MVQGWRPGEFDGCWVKTHDQRLPRSWWNILMLLLLMMGICIVCIQKLQIWQNTTGKRAEPVLPASSPWLAARPHWRGKSKLQSRPIALEQCSGWTRLRLGQLRTWILLYLVFSICVNLVFGICERTHLSGKMSDRGSSFSRTATRDSFVSDMEKQPRHRHSSFLTYFCICCIFFFFCILYFCI